MSIFEDKMIASLADLHLPLLEWYDRCKREMPWRGASDSYFVWVSEIMLQQTRVEAVRAYFLRFTAALPTLQHLARCDEETLLKLWEGLGYYNRVRNMQKAAKIVVEQYGGELPRSYEQLLTLPGIGEYTAGAIASIAYNIPVPCVDGNVLRVLSRITANSADISLPAVKKEYQVLAQNMIPAEIDLPASGGRAGDFNQSLMELGATVCLPNGAPLCDVCPVRTRCAAFLAGNPQDYPVKPAKPARKTVKKTISVLICGDLVLLRKRPDDGLLAGLWEFWNADGWLNRDELTDQLTQQGISVTAVHSLKKAKHIFSHIEWQMQGYLVYTDKPSALEDGEWVKLTELRESYALPGALKAYSKELERWVQQ
ncbi:A/G-specific adenine glycosylase [Hydrogenoanaerobacterium sp.]|uniref:A/G-specific adenine glycosylase n=1 Tax=Hydrogenoanaerobacterium sp. TaxID=2953763 RepID=UPI0028996A46|nr:A/G-specific adenine glycosylase [Hydrogenoanaerobacterium sp.]